MKKTALFLILIIFVYIFVCTASYAEVKKASIQKAQLSFEQAYDLLLTNNNTLKAVDAEIKQRKYEKYSAMGQFFPKVGINTTYAHFNDSIGVSVMGHEMKMQDENVWGLGAGAVWNIFTGGKVLAANRAAHARFKGANEKLRQIQGDLICELTKRYFGLVMANSVVEVRRQVYDGMKKHLDDAQKLEKHGMIPKSERLHAQVAFSQADRDLKAAIRDRNIIQDGLKNLIKDESANLDGVEVETLSALFMYQADISNVDECKQNARENNPKLMQLEVKKELARENHRAKMSSYSPTVSLFAYDIFTSKNLSYQVPKWSVGATVNFVAFDGLSRFNDVRAANQIKQEAAYEKLAAQNDIETLVNKYFQELQKYKESYESSTDAIESAQESLRVSIRAFQEGMGTSLNVTDAQMALSKVKIEQLQSVYNFDVTLAQLLNAQGKAQELIEIVKNSKTEKL